MGPDTLSIDRLMEMHPLTLRLLLCMQRCHCGHNLCRICSRRCVLSMSDGCDVSYPVIGSDNQLYDAFELRSYALWCWNRDKACIVIPNSTITHVSLIERHAMRRLILGYTHCATQACTRGVRYLLSPSRKDASTQTSPTPHETGPLHTVEEVGAWWRAYPRPQVPTPPPLRTRPRPRKRRYESLVRQDEPMHPFPRSIYEHSPRAVSLFCAGRVSDTA